MPSLPLSTAFTDSAVTEGGFKTAITNQREFLSGLLGTDGVNATALATLGALFGSLTVKSTNYTVVSGDRGKIIQCTDTLTVSLTAAATLGAGFSFVVSNTGAGTVTIDPSGSELIGGELTQTLEENQTVVIYCTGTAFQIAGGGGSNYAMTTFTAPGTWTKPTGLKAVKVTVIGGGGVAMAAMAGAPASPTFTAAGTSSFGAFLSATGGANAPASFTVALGGTGSGGDLNSSGGDSMYFSSLSLSPAISPDTPATIEYYRFAYSGRGAFGFSSETILYDNVEARKAGKPYGGGAGYYTGSRESASLGVGGGGGGSIEFIPAPTIPGPVTVTVGAGGTTAGPTPLAVYRSLNGADGVVIVEEFY